MEDRDSRQLELFSQGKKISQPRPEFSGSFSKLVRANEKTILVIFGMIIAAIVSFSLGVKKGKALMTEGLNSRPDNALEKVYSTTPVATSSQPVSEPDNQETIRKIANLQPELPKKEPLRLQNYTIQIASYRTKINAQKEAERLKRKGYTSVILSKGSFSILCVGNFPRQESAKPLLTELKKLYRDSYIRRL